MLIARQTCFWDGKVQNFWRWKHKSQIEIGVVGEWTAYKVNGRDSKESQSRAKWLQIVWIQALTITKWIKEQASNIRGRAFESITEQIAIISSNSAH